MRKQCFENQETKKITDICIKKCRKRDIKSNDKIILNRLLTTFNHLNFYVYYLLIEINLYNFTY